MKKILYLSLVDWFWIKQRPQHISEMLSEKNKVTYLGRTTWRKNSNVLVPHSVNEDKKNEFKIEINKNLLVIRKRLIPLQGKFNIIEKINSKLYKRVISNLEKKNNYDAIILTSPSQYDMIPKHLFKQKVFFYDCMDSHKNFPNVRKQKIILDERNIISISKYITVSSNDLYNKLINENSNIKDKIQIVNNGVDVKTFDINKVNKINDVNIFKRNNKKRVGYLGTISEWLDFDMIKNIALRNNEIDFYIIGPVAKGTDIEKYSKIDNLVFTGSQPYNSVPNILNELNICIMPFKITELIESVNPVKIYEYLAMGKPVIASRYKETLRFGNLIYTYNTEEEFEKLLRMLINKKENEEIIKKRVDFAKDNSWRKRSDQIEKIINTKTGNLEIDRSQSPAL